MSKAGFRQANPSRADRFLFVFLILLLGATLLVSNGMAEQGSQGPVPSAVEPQDRIILNVGLYENSPKIFTDAQGRASGFWPDIVRHIADQEGWSVQWVPGTWQECLQRLADHQIDIMPDMGWTRPRSERFAFSRETVLLSWSRLYTRKGDDIVSILDLEGKTVAALAGSFNLDGPEGIKEMARNFELDCTFVEMSSYEAVFEALENGRIDAGVTNKDFGNLHEHDYNVTRTPILFQPARMQFAFTKHAVLSPYLIEKVDGHIRELKEDSGSIY